MGVTDAGCKFIFDISAILNYVERNDRYSGIQRVVACLLSEFAKLGQTSNMFLAFVDRRGRYVCFPYQQLGSEALLSPMALRARFFRHRLFNDHIPALERYKGDKKKYLYHRTRLDLAALLGRESSFRRYNMTADMWRGIRGIKDPATGFERTIVTKPLEEVTTAGDHLVLLDASWTPRHSEAFKAAENRGMVVHTFVYDLVPLVAPGTVDLSVSENFHDWLIQSADYTTQYIAISEATRNDLRHFLKSHAIEKDVSVVPMAQARLPSSEKMPGNRAMGPLTAKINRDAYPFLADTVGLKPDIRQTVSVPYVLCVGTIEARKNTWRMVAAWKKLIDGGHYDVPRLVFAGRRGWMRSDFDDIIAGTGSLYGWVRIIEGPTDSELEYLYKNCQFAIMTSLYEGWGLPVGEALSYGKTSVVSKVSSLTEVGGDLVEYCDAESITSIADAVWRLCSDPERRRDLERSIAATQLRSWRDAAEDLQRVVADRSANGGKAGYDPPPI